MKIQIQAAFLLFLLKLVTLHAETIEIVSNMYTEEILTEMCFEKIKSAYELRIVDQKYQIPMSDYPAGPRSLFGPLSSMTTS